VLFQFGNSFFILALTSRLHNYFSFSSSSPAW